MVTFPASSTITSSCSAAPRACAAPPCTWPRHCRGLTTKPASAACTLCRIRSSPVRRCTATRTPWTLKATERGEPSQCASASRGESSVLLAARSSQVTRVPVGLWRRPAASPAQSPARSPPGSRPPPGTCSPAGARPPAAALSSAVATPASADARWASSPNSVCAAWSVALPATTVPAEPYAPVSWPTSDVSDWRIVSRSGAQPSAAAASWTCTVVVPLPNSAVPTRTSIVPSGRSARRLWEKWPRGGMVSSIDSAIPVPTAQSGPSPGAPAPAASSAARPAPPGAPSADSPSPSPGAASASSTRSRHWSSP